MKPRVAPLSKSQSHTVAWWLTLVNGRLTRSIRNHRAAGLTASQISAMATIEDLGPIRISELASRESIGAPVATRLTTSLEELGYIKRIQDANDKRACFVEITAAGHRVLRNLWESRVEGINERIQRLSKSEIEVLNAALPILEKLTKEV
ncbi:MAG: MarR family transcriptional regulator [Candidatus Nanopelagicaceae bacterium]